MPYKVVDTYQLALMLKAPMEDKDNRAIKQAGLNLLEHGGWTLLHVHGEANDPLFYLHKP